MSKTTHYELNTPIGSEVLSVMTGLNPNFNTIDKTMYDNETRSTQALNKANVNEQNIATALGRITTAEGDIDTLQSGLETANTNISGLTSRMGTAEGNIVNNTNAINNHSSDISLLNTSVNAIKELNIGTFTTKPGFPVNSTYTYLKKRNNIVEFQIDFANAISGSQSQVIEFPEGFRPTENCWFPIISANGNSRPARFEVYPDGQARIVNVGADIVNCVTGLFMI